MTCVTLIALLTFNSYSHEPDLPTFAKELQDMVRKEGQIVIDAIPLEQVEAVKRMVRLTPGVITEAIVREKDSCYVRVGKIHE